MFEHQRMCLQWLWELHQQEVGGILGDEMGLGKTLQWRREIERFAPEISPVEVLHHSQGGADPGNRLALLRSVCSPRGGRPEGACSVCVTSYEMVRSHASQLLRQPWQYVVLDEGHKIRNPHAEITQVCKQFNTAHRLILSGAPIQNKLTELWSLFDFVFPGKLGTLPTFEEHFALPIAMGTYANASEFKARESGREWPRVETAARCSMVLRDLLRPYLLRRMKADVSVALPDKSEKVLFCRLTQTQRDAYEAYLATDHVEAVLSGRAHAFAALTSLLKVCNHPHLLNWDAQDRQAAAAAEQGVSGAPRYGDWRLSGKMRVLHQVLRTWHKGGDRVLLFCQTRQMLDIVQSYVDQQGYAHSRLDGNTSVAQRLKLIDTFNQDDSIFLFLLTTRAGGLGINLTGANRVVLVDPDWNPANDLQARERAWRVGQTRAVAVFRLVTGGTLEEKVYQRQVFKQETGLLEKLLRGDMLSGTLDHEREVGSGKGRDASMPSKEARQVAERAAAALRRSTDDCASRPSMRLPTWTGRNDGAGAPHRFGQALSRKIAASAASASGGSAGGSFFAAGQGAAAAIGSSALLQRELCSFFRSHGGRVSSEQLVARFRACPEPHLFKQLLKQVAKQQRKVWILDASLAEG
ncbi:hypothetical protein EMIHUDRAFT_201306 [Emiliania huxleyi CCMP1516]|uniref:Uncharacterized protein n=2 Tax=Emiliania huxleyi TaxID=2903 RepID=A0A0D3KMH3_EMIH1|nr:hypothetical protein EMIHUDRAFT_201306 [Emiliania huxleyi CCMP1516]EOD36958.1 hypothetical protein EMIHUDRAFT_201306 [Emiliania huxleyi CCMP1516]|eukprot:XP_005789387.1 hypothetical protein EMIHUDRAFT_201306 [Emiliania huxleyi CCMP1516]